MHRAIKLKNKQVVNFIGNRHGIHFMIYISLWRPVLEIIGVNVLFFVN